MRQKLAQIVDRHRGVQVHRGARHHSSLLKGELPGPEASVGQDDVWWERHQRAAGAWLMEILGPVRPAHVTASEWAVDQAGLWQHTFLRSRANSIEGGTTEIQKQHHRRARARPTRKAEETS